MPNITTSILVFYFAYKCAHTYLCEMVFAIFCLYFVHIDIGYGCIVFNCIIGIYLLTCLYIPVYNS